MDNMRNNHRTEQISNDTVLFLPNQKREKKVVNFFNNSSKYYW